MQQSKTRLKNLQDVLKNIQLQNNKKYPGQYCEVLVENKIKNEEKFFGRNRFLTPVIFESDQSESGKLVNVKITSYDQGNLFGSHVGNKIKAA